MRPVDITGQRFGRLVALRPTSQRRSGKVMWLCQCDCGNTTLSTSNNLKSGGTRSCGCLYKETRQGKLKHGMTGERLHRIWKGMHSRCNNKNAKSYENYGGRGISICNEWNGDNGFLNFYEWSMKHGYADNLTIDRIDVNGDYTPNNCRWVTQHEQTRNKRNTINLTAQGKTMCLTDWITKYGYRVHYLYWHKGKAEAVKWLEEQEVKKWELLSNTN